MKRVLLDENLDWRLKHALDPSFHVQTVRERGWNGLKDSELLHTAEPYFDVLVTLDRSMQHQQSLAQFSLAVLLIEARSSARARLLPAMPRVSATVLQAEPGRLYVVTA